MEIVKKNILSIVCGVVALLSLIALYWPIGGWYGDMREVLDARVKVERDLASLRKLNRVWPIIPQVDATAPPKLDGFPNQYKIEAGNKVKEEIHTQAAAMKKATAENNVHKLLVAGVLPNPSDSNLGFEFRRQYLEMVQKSLHGSLQRSRVTGGVVDGSTLAAMPPTKQEIEEAGGRLYTDKYEPKVIKVGDVEVNGDQITGDWLKECDTLQSKMWLQTAQKIKVYIEPDWLKIQARMPNNTEHPDQVDIWYAQNMLWVEGDVVEAIARINADAADVTHAPIKHIFRIDIPDELYVRNSSQPVNGAPADAPGKAFTISPTGRVCNPLYDVIQFQMVVNVEKQKVPAILAELQKGKLITVQQFDLMAVDGIAAANEGFIYGDVEVVKLSISGEEVFLRDWTVPLMPEPIKQKLQIVAPTPNPK